MSCLCCQSVSNSDLSNSDLDYRPTCLKVTILTTLLDSFTHRLKVLFEDVFPFSIKVAFFTSILHVVKGYISELSYSCIAHNYILLLHAQILHVVVSGPFELPYSNKDHSFIYNKIFYMLLKSVFVIYFIVTMLTTICNFFIGRFNTLS